eukprot:GEMP01029523.1.p1 GENE.GEMP01029523.1~~GEMP01029523.1.p1  ORF type:complete len:503 (+),score=78.46 GEMP01029523.1:69-1577(+)
MRWFMTPRQILKTDGTPPNTVERHCRWRRFCALVAAFIIYSCLSTAAQVLTLDSDITKLQVPDHFTACHRIARCCQTYFHIIVGASDGEAAIQRALDNPYPWKLIWLFGTLPSEALRQRFCDVQQHGLLFKKKPCECVESPHNVTALWRRTTPDDVIISQNTDDGVDLWAVNEEYVSTGKARILRTGGSFKAFVRHHGAPAVNGKNIHETISILKHVPLLSDPAIPRGFCCQPSKCTPNPKRIPFGRNFAGIGVTVVQLGFYQTRFENFVQQYREYSVPELVDQIILVWNDPFESPPPLPDYPKVPVTIVHMSHNSLNNRFLIGDLVRTASVLAQDDDQMLYRPYLECMYEQWSRSYQSSIMSPYARYGDANAGTYTLHPWRWYNIAITSQAMFHSRFLHAFADDRYTELRALVDSKRNGEDIAFNAVAQYVAGRPPIYVQASIWWWFLRKSRTKINEGYGLSARKNSTADWTAERGNIVARVAQLFPRNPFLESDKIATCG